MQPVTFPTQSKKTPNPTKIRKYFLCNKLSMFEVFLVIVLMVFTLRPIRFDLKSDCAIWCDFFYGDSDPIGYCFGSDEISVFHDCFFLSVWKLSARWALHRLCQPLLRINFPEIKINGPKSTFVFFSMPTIQYMRISELAECSFPPRISFIFLCLVSSLNPIILITLPPYHRDEIINRLKLIKEPPK